MLASLSLLLFGCSDFAGGPSSATKSINGIASDGSGQPIANASVTMTAQNATGGDTTPVVAKTTADANGAYTLTYPASAVPNGYVLHATQSGLGKVISTLAKLVGASTGPSTEYRAYVPRGDNSTRHHISQATEVVVLLLLDPTNLNAGATQKRDFDTVVGIVNVMFQLPAGKSIVDCTPYNPVTKTGEPAMLVAIKAVTQALPDAASLNNMVQSVLLLPKDVLNANADSNLSTVFAAVAGNIQTITVSLKATGSIPAEYTVDPAAVAAAVNLAFGGQVTTKLAPAAPTGLKVAASGATASSVPLQWDAVAVTAGQVGYTVYRADASGVFSAIGVVMPTPNATANPSSFVDTTVVPGISYQYQVAAFDATPATGIVVRKPSDPSNICAVTTPARTVRVTPPAPTGLVLLAQGTTVNATTSAVTSQVTLSWSMGPSDTATGMSYLVYRNGQYLDTTNKLAYTDNTVQPGVTYTYYIKSVIGDSVPSAASTLLTVKVQSIISSSLVTPGAPTLVTKDTGSITFNWDASASNSAGATSYNVYRDGSLIASGLLAGNLGTYTDSGLLPATSYTYAITAVNGTQETDPAKANKTTFQTGGSISVTLNPPTALMIPQYTSTSMQLVWTASAFSFTSDVAGYEIFRTTSASPSNPNTDLTNWTKVTTVTATGFTDLTVAPATTYSYAIRAYGANGLRSAFSNTSAAKTWPAADLSNTTTPPVPSGLQAVTTTFSVGLTWNASLQASGTTNQVQGFTIYRAVVNGSDTATAQANLAPIAKVAVGDRTATSFSYSDNTAQASTTYLYSVQAFDNAGNTSDYKDATAQAQATTLSMADATYNISGAVTINGLGLPGVAITCTNGTQTIQTTTDVNGVYVIANVKPGDYTITPSYTLYYVLTPSSKAVTVSTANLTGQNFTAAFTGVVNGGLTYPNGTIIGGISYPNGSYVNGVYYPYVTVIGGISYPTAAVIGGVTYPDGSIVGGIALPSASAAASVAYPSGTVIGGIIYPTGPSATGNLGVPTGVVINGIVYPNGIVTNGVLFPQFLQVGTVYPTGNANGVINYPSGKVTVTTSYATPYVLYGTIASPVAGAQVTLNPGGISVDPGPLGYYYFAVGTGSYTVTYNGTTSASFPVDATHLVGPSF